MAEMGAVKETFHERIGERGTRALGPQRLSLGDLARGRCHDRDACAAGGRRGAAARARDAEAFKGGMTVKEINAAFGERAGELKKPAKRRLIDMGLIHLFMM